MNLEQPVDLKKTVNLPRTGFAMKGNLPQTEPILLKRWETEGLYQQIRAARAGRPKYVLHDGPPYANGNIHLGHALNKSLKDFIVKSKTMEGFDSPYVPGWDCHGLPIEIKVDGELGAKKAKMPAASIRRACRKYAEKYVNLQRKDFIRLGILGQWDDPYLTMSPKYQSVIAGAFVDFLHQGYVYKGLKPVNWCLHDRTALAEAEVEYENHTSPSIWVRFELDSDPAAIDPALAGRQVFGLIWTTTPWTIPANVGIAYHPKFEYVAVEVDGAAYIVARDLLQTTSDCLSWRWDNMLAQFPGARLDRAVFRHPFLDRDSLGINGDHVTLEQGTGAVHTAPGHGHEDYVAGRHYGLPTYCPVDAEGRFFHAEGASGRLPEELIGKTVWEANPIVTRILEESGALMGQQKIEHSYPHCWRCHNPTIYRATEQWFIGMDRNDLRTRALEAVRGIKWNPSWGEERIYNMIRDRPDWCISRQRIWGVPIVVFYCDGCHEPLVERRILDRVVQSFEEQSADIWYEKTAAELIGEEYSCTKCGGASFSKENDILDVWFDSGSSHLAVLGHSAELPWPADMYLEGGDQYRGWFHSSLLVGVALKGAAPYRECATNGWTLDGEGRAMSKSAGNGVDPEDIIKLHGADVLRLWVSSVEFNEDVRMSETILLRTTEAYRKLRNTFRYALSNLGDFDPELDTVASSDLLPIDKWILGSMRTVVDECLEHYRNFAFHRVYRRIYDFTTTELSSVYFDACKDRLYTSAPNWIERRSAQTALYRINSALVRLLAPILSFTTEEVWSHMVKPAGAVSSVHLAEFPSPDELLESSKDASSDWASLLDTRHRVLTALETARQNKEIGSGLEAHVTLGSDAVLEQHRSILPDLFIVSQVSLNGTGVRVERASGDKCERCWKYTDDVGEDSAFPTACARCARAVHEMAGPQS